ncbi:MAG: helix-turn-helix domain-containing protein [Nitrospinae bacterium]|nr:helix-turn-helix domain-containing protein [Nitrospinota bacterium]
MVENIGLSRKELSQRLGYNVRTIYRWETGETIPKRAVLDCLREQSSPYGQFHNFTHSGFTFIDLFTGIVGLRIGFEKIGGRCVFASESGISSPKIPLAHFPSCNPNARDITVILAEDMLSYGIPYAR